jgi:hypothetical protein
MDERRDQIVNVRLSRSERGALTLMAEQGQLTQSEMVREIIRLEAVRRGVLVQEQEATCESH